MILDDADTNLPLPEYCDRDEDEIRFHHKSFIDYLLDPSRSLENCVDLEEMRMRLGLACIVAMQTFSLQPTPSRITCSRFSLSFIYNVLIPHAECSYLGLCNTLLDPSCHSFRNSRLLQALLSFDLFACYLNTLGFKVGSECQARDTIKRVAFPSRPTLISKITEKL